MKNSSLIILIILVISACKNYQKVEKSIPEPNKKFNSVIIDVKRDLLYNNVNSASQKLIEIINNDTLNHVAYYELSKIKFEQKDFIEAENYARKAYELRPENNSYAILYLYVLYANNKNKIAEKVLNKILKNDEKNPDLYFQIFEILEDVSQFEKLIEITEKFEELFGYSNDIILSKYQIYISTKNINGAIKYLKTVIKNDKINDLPYQLLGELYYHFDKKDTSFEYYKKGWELNKSNPQINLGLIKYFIDRRKINEAFKLFNEIITDYSIDVDVKVLILLEFYKIEKEFDLTLKSELENFTNILSTTYNDRPEFLYIKGNVCLQKYKLDEALYYFTKSLSIKPDNLELWNISIYIAEQIKNYERMISIADSAIRFFPSNRDFYYFRGYAFYNKEKYQESYNDYKFALLLTGDGDKERQSILHALAEVTYKLRNVNESFNIYDSILKNDPKDIIALNNYAYFLALEKRDLEKAKEMSQKTIKADPKNPTYLDTYAYILFLKKEYKEALKYIELAILNGGGLNDTILEHYGDILYFNDQLEMAVTTWKEAKERGNGSGKLDLKIQQRKYIDE